MVRAFSILLFLCIQSVALLGQSDSIININNVSLKNIYYVDTGVYRSEQPSIQDFKHLVEIGIKEVLNLRNWHSNDDEIGDANIISHRVKMNAHSINNKDVIEALRIIKNRKGPIVFHCRHGSDRTGTIAAMYRIIFQGWSKEKALDELMKGGYGYHKVFINIPIYIKDVNIEYIRHEVFKD